MTNRRFRIPVKALAAFLSAACFLAFEIAVVSPVLAADPVPPAPGQPATGQSPPGSTWDTWPRKPEAPVTTRTMGAAAAGETAGESTSAGISRGTWGWIAGIAAAGALIAVAAGGGGGGGDTTTPTHH